MFFWKVASKAYIKVIKPILSFLGAAFLATATASRRENGVCQSTHLAEESLNITAAKNWLVYLPTETVHVNSSPPADWCLDKCCDDPG